MGTPSETPEAQKTILLLASEKQVHAFEISPTMRVTVGRHDTNDLQLASRTVSNFHAEVTHQGGAPVLRDLGSTNGTYVNDQAVTEARLEAGDRIRIGNHVLSVHLDRLKGNREGFFRYRRHSDYFVVGASGRIMSMRASSQQALKTLQVSDPHDLSLPDLLKILTTNARSVSLRIRKEDEGARVFIRKDKIVHAEYAKAKGEKALYRVFGWHEAMYEIGPFPTKPPVPRTINLPADTLIMEGMKQIEELARLITQLQPLEAPLHLKEDCTLPVSAHSSAEMEIYQAIIRHRTVAAVLEETTMTDCRTLRLIHALLRKGVFAVSDVSEYLPEETIVYRLPTSEPQ